MTERTLRSGSTGWVLLLVALLLPLTCERNKLADGYPDEFSCSSCHGSEANFAPPVSVGGETETSAVQVGAHQNHLRGGSITGGIECSECHQVPTSIDSDGHIDGEPAEVKFGTRATAGGVLAQWDRDSATCKNVYCHGATLPGGKHKEPVWTTTDGSQIACDSCHGFPPPSEHTPSTDCFLCHSDTVLPDGTINLESGKHVNGVIEVAGFHPAGWYDPTMHGKDAFNKGIGSCAACHGTDLLGGTAKVSCEKCHPGFQTNCTFCHGGLDNDTGAPPVDLAHNATPEFTGVGAHSRHVLTESTWHKTFGCDECHTVPADILAEGHMDGGKAEVTFGKLATSNGAKPTWDGTSCSAVYCHGGTIGDGPPVVPKWTETFPACGSCHALPPPPPHPQHDKCFLCHGCVVDEKMAIIKENAHLHINGKPNIEKKTNCPGKE